MFKVIMSLVVLAGQFLRYPSDVREIISGSFIEGIRLYYPAWYILFAPFFHAADHITILSLNQHMAFLAILNLAWVFKRFFLLRKGVRPTACVRPRLGKGDLGLAVLAKEIFRVLGFNAVFAMILGAVILIPRPMARLEVHDPDILIYDAHSHTSHSWDAKESFTPEKNLLWHQKAGFHAAFITDHNTIQGSAEARGLYPLMKQAGGTIPPPDFGSKKTPLPPAGGGG